MKWGSAMELCSRQVLTEKGITKRLLESIRQYMCLYSGSYTLKNFPIWPPFSHLSVFYDFIATVLFYLTPAGIQEIDNGREIVTG